MNSTNLKFVLTGVRIQRWGYRFESRQAQTPVMPKKAGATS